MRREFLIKATGDDSEPIGPVMHATCTVVFPVHQFSRRRTSWNRFLSSNCSTQ